MWIVSQPKTGSQMEIPICILWFCCNGFIHPTKLFLLTNQRWGSLIQFEQDAGVLDWFPSLLGHNETLILNYQPGSGFSSAQSCWCCSSTSALPRSSRREQPVMWEGSKLVYSPPHWATLAAPAAGSVSVQPGLHWDFHPCREWERAAALPWLPNWVSVTGQHCFGSVCLWFSLEISPSQM